MNYKITSWSGEPNEIPDKPIPPNNDDCWKLFNTDAIPIIRKERVYLAQFVEPREKTITSIKLIWTWWVP